MGALYSEGKLEEAGIMWAFCVPSVQCVCGTKNATKIIYYVLFGFCFNWQRLMHTYWLQCCLDRSLLNDNWAFMGHVASEQLTNSLLKR